MEEDSRERAHRALENLEREVVRATRLIEELRRENAALRQQMGALDGAPAAARFVPAEGGGEDEGRWALERQALADRLKTIIGRFQWLEGGSP